MNSKKPFKESVSACIFHDTSTVWGKFNWTPPLCEDANSSDCLYEHPFAGSTKELAVLILG